MPVAETCTTDVGCLWPQASALEAARLIRQKYVGDVMVVNDQDSEQTPLGVATDRDLAIEHAHGVRRIPLADAHGVPHGIVTLDDLPRTLLADVQATLA
jgi:CBS domain-containing protein